MTRFFPLAIPVLLSFISADLAQAQLPKFLRNTPFDPSTHNPADWVRSSGRPAGSTSSLAVDESYSWISHRGEILYAPHDRSTNGAGNLRPTGRYAQLIHNSQGQASWHAPGCRNHPLRAPDRDQVTTRQHVIDPNSGVVYVREYRGGRQVSQSPVGQANLTWEPGSGRAIYRWGNVVSYANRPAQVPVGPSFNGYAPNSRQSQPSRTPEEQLVIGILELIDSANR